MFKLQHQFNNIIETSQTLQLTNDQMPEFRCHCIVRSVHNSSKLQHKPSVA